MLGLGVRAWNLGSWLIRSPRWVPLPCWCGTAELDGAAVLSDGMMRDVVVAGPGFAREGHVSRTQGDVDAHRRYVSELVFPFVALVVRLRSRAVVSSFPAARRSHRRAGVQADRLFPASGGDRRAWSVGWFVVLLEAPERCCRAEFLRGGSPIEYLEGALAVQGFPSLL